MTRTAGGPGAGDVKPARRSKQKQDGPRGQDCPLVAIGASAGGIPALTRFFGAMPEDPGAAFIVVLHLSPSHESHLAEVLQRSTKLSVVAVGKSTAIRVGCVYVIAPDSVLRIAEGRLSARKPSTDMERRHPVDAIFQSLAEERGRLAICVVLSGSGSNGSAGALKVHEAEGLVL
ncbi:MAG: chemotaxis protein CheB, partial [Tistlia sp.]